MPNTACHLMIRCPTYSAISRPSSSAYGLDTVDCVHTHRLGLSHTPNCPCETGPQTPEHILQTCPLHQEARTDHWPQGATLQEQLWGTKGSLILTTSFIQATKLEI
ncbi:hypothetical protein V1264_008143 [Littorina saxatilis]|uniref:Uncharacterized protein n=2 Tax=Littorina saxatilis TaxID=31220 RepID=A0AAN9ATT7_9CAEN